METGVVSALDRPAAELTVMDVYDIAAVLGQEFERIIDRFGCESLVGVVPKVVRVLELLEALVSRGATGQEAEELRRELDRLRQERSDRYEQERKHQECGGDSGFLDSDKPRFTLQELRDVLQEKNELKAQVFMLQEELAYYKRIFTAIMPMVAAGLLADDPTLLPIRRLSFV
uniref:RILP-like protein 2 n=1 Tax=Mastacembelus armatus TaxID=205130 RepID=A0A7N8WSB4_9TELE